MPTTTSPGIPGSEEVQRSPAPRQGPAALSGVGLTLRYGARPVLEDVGLAIRAGQVTALIGPNGSGKSTLLRSMARLHPIADGELRVGDEPAAPLSARAFARVVTLLSQGRPSPAGISVRDVVGYGRYPHRRRWREGDPDGPEAVEWAMRATGVTDFGDRPIDHLSGGERQRVWLATALAQRTEVLLLDEPTTYLDLRYQVEVLDLVRDLADEHTVAVGVVLHDLNQAAAVADRVVLLADGRVVGAGAPSEVFTPEALSVAYGITVEVRTDPVSGRIACAPVGRHNAAGVP